MIKGLHINKLVLDILCTRITTCIILRGRLRCLAPTHVPLQLLDITQSGSEGSILDSKLVDEGSTFLPSSVGFVG